MLKPTVFSVVLVLACRVCAAQDKITPPAPSQQKASEAAKFVLNPPNQFLKIGAFTWKLDDLRPLELPNSSLVQPVLPLVIQIRELSEPVVPEDLSDQLSLH
jgi:hypothetical protein